MPTHKINAIKIMQYLAKFHQNWMKSLKIITKKKHVFLDIFEVNTISSP